ncbi:MAG: hypothetical protein IRY91_12120 [Gemmatimonadaceae bacterium]|nr:hypothetical protein [Gemmatimonadaceae bacterium]
MTSHRPRRITPSTCALAAVLALGAVAPRAAAQADIPLDGRATWGWRVGPMFEHWSFGCCSDSSVGGSVKTASEWSVPVVALVPIGRNVTIDAYAAWMRGTVTRRDASAGSPQTLQVSGLTDTKLRASVRLGGDAFLATFGVSLPTGKTSLDAEELAALQVIGAPALRMQTPVLGTGWGGTSGLVYTRRIGAWSWGIGGSYEYRGKYSPAQAASLGLGSGDLELHPGQAFRLSLGADGLVGQSAMSMSASSTFFTHDQVTLSAGGPVADRVTLGPMFTGEWQLRAASSLFRELNVYLFDRYRTKYSRGGAKVDGTDGNELELGARGLVPLSPTLALVTGARARHYSGLSIDNTLATAASASGGIQVGLAWTTGTMVVSPVVGGEIGRIKTGNASLSTHKLEAMFTISPR